MMGAGNVRRQTEPTTPHFVTLRSGSAADVDAMAAIEVAAFSDPWPTSAFHDLLNAAHARVTVATDASDRTVGYCVLLFAADEAEIANIAVSPRLRRNGIAAQLLDEALVAATELGAAEVFLEVRMSNRSARGLYGSRGFMQVGRRPSYYRLPTEDALVLRRATSHVA